MDLPRVSGNRKNGIADAMRQAIAAASFFLNVFSAWAHFDVKLRKNL